MEADMLGLGEGLNEGDNDILNDGDFDGLGDQDGLGLEMGSL